MNANEVIAHVAGTGVHPNDHVNLGQSSNDVIPTAMHVAAAQLVHDELLPAMYAMEQALVRKSIEFQPVVVHIQYSLKNPVDGFEFVLPTDAHPYVSY